MKVRIEDWDRYIICRDGYYLIAITRDDWHQERWGRSLWDAAQIERKQVARILAYRMNGEIIKFNRITGARSAVM